MSHDTAALEPSFDPLLNEKQLCSWLGVGQATLSRWRYAGTGPRFVHLGPRRLAYRKSEVERWLAERERESGGITAAVASATQTGNARAA